MNNKTYKLWSTTANKIRDLKKNWPFLSYEQIAEQIIELEDLRPKDLTQQREIQNLHFSYQYPLNLDMRSFKKEILKIADRILKSDSTLPFSNELSLRQQQEILRLAGKAA